MTFNNGKSWGDMFPKAVEIPLSSKRLLMGRPSCGDERCCLLERCLTACQIYSCMAVLNTL